MQTPFKEYLNTSRAKKEPMSKSYDGLKRKLRTSINTYSTELLLFQDTGDVAPFFVCNYIFYYLFGRSAVSMFAHRRIRFFASLFNKHPCHNVLTRVWRHPLNNVRLNASICHPLISTYRYSVIRWYMHIEHIKLVQCAVHSAYRVLELSDLWLL